MKKILLVEDNEYIMDINARCLTNMGYCVEKAYSARAAENVLTVGQPDLVVLDIMQPENQSYTVGPLRFDIV